MQLGNAILVSHKHYIQAAFISQRIQILIPRGKSLSRTLAANAKLQTYELQNYTEQYCGYTSTMYRLKQNWKIIRGSLDNCQRS